MRTEIKAAIEALLFASGERVAESDLMELLQLGKTDLDQIMQEIIEDYRDSGRGIQVLKLDDGYIMATKAEYSMLVSQLIKPAIRRLSPAALETLAVIAYRQPVSKVEIEQIRGVKSDRVLASLMEKGLIKEAGRKPVPGRPLLYETTHEFLKVFSISNLEELPRPKNEEENLGDGKVIGRTDKDKGPTRPEIGQVYEQYRGIGGRTDT